MPPTVAPHPTLKRKWLRRLLFLCGLYAAVVIVFKLLENTLVFQRTTAAESWRTPSAELAVQDVWMTAADGTSVHGWWSPSPAGGSGAVLVAHGNGGNISMFTPWAADLRTALNRGVLMFDYPGYGKSGGKPSEAGCYASADAAWAWLTEEAKISPMEIVLFGNSLGGGVLIDVATRHDCRAVVLVRTYTSLPAAASHRYWFLPTHAMMANRFDSLSKIPKCHSPVFVAHGTRDQTIPYRQGEQLFAAANEPKRFLRLDGLGHNDPLPAEFYSELKAFLRDTP